MGRNTLVSYCQKLLDKCESIARIVDRYGLVREKSHAVFSRETKHFQQPIFLRHVIAGVEIQPQHSYRRQFAADLGIASAFHELDSLPPIERYSLDSQIGIFCPASIPMTDHWEMKDVLAPIGFNISKQ